MEMKVLLVDDEEEFVTTLCERIQLRGIDASVVFSGEAALERLSTDPPGVMVLDLKMPGIGGMEVLIRTAGIAPETAVIILTGHGDSRDEERARREGAFDYLQKPVDLATLIQVIGAAGRKGAMKQEKRGEPEASSLGTE